MTRSVGKLYRGTTSVTQLDRIASATDLPCAVSTSTCRNFATIFSGLVEVRLPGGGHFSSVTSRRMLKTSFMSPILAFARAMPMVCTRPVLSDQIHAGADLALGLVRSHALLSVGGDGCGAQAARFQIRSRLRPSGKRCRSRRRPSESYAVLSQRGLMVQTYAVPRDIWNRRRSGEPMDSTPSKVQRAPFWARSAWFMAISEPAPSTHLKKP